MFCNSKSAFCAVAVYNRQTTKIVEWAIGYCSVGSIASLPNETQSKAMVSTVSKFKDSRRFQDNWKVNSAGAVVLTCAIKSEDIIQRRFSLMSQNSM